MDNLKVGDCVEVRDPGLTMLRSVVLKYQPDARPNNIGEINEVRDDEYLICFPIGDDLFDE